MKILRMLPGIVMIVAGTVGLLLMGHFWFQAREIADKAIAAGLRVTPSREVLDRKAIAIMLFGAGVIGIGIGLLGKEIGLKPIVIAIVAVGVVGAVAFAILHAY